MDYNQFKNLLNLKDIRNKDSVPMLEELIEKFPYFQTARVLLAKSLYEQQSIHYDEALKIAAAYSPDRKVLQELIQPSPIIAAGNSFSAPPPPQEKPSYTPPPSTPSVPEVKHEAIVPPKLAEREWYSEDEISGRAFEEQDQKEKIVDPHKIIQQRLSEILAVPNQAKEELTRSKPSEISEQTEIPQAKQVEEQKDVIDIKKPEITAEQPSGVAHEEPSVPAPIDKTVAKQEEIISPDNNRSEEIILEEAGKAHDILDRMEIEHALEESILSSLEKLPIIAEEKTSPPIPSLKSEQIKLTPEIVKAKDESTKPDLSKPKSFTEWMSAISVKPFNRFEEVHQNQKASAATREENPAHYESNYSFEEEESHHSQEEEVSEDELIDKFIATKPKIVPSKAEFYSPVSQAKKSLIEHEDLVTETLARIYTGQGHFAKAKWCYEKLSLLYPEKSSYFAALIKDINERLNEGMNK